MRKILQFNFYNGRFFIIFKMIYNFNALDVSDEDEDEEPQQSQILTVEDKKIIEIKDLEKKRDELRKELYQLTKKKSDSDQEHQTHIKELSKQVVKLSTQADEVRTEANNLEAKLKTMPVTPSSPQVQKQSADPNSDLIRTLRIQADSLKTEITKAKRVLSQEGGCKNRAIQIKRLKAQLEDISSIGRPSSSASLEYTPQRQTGNNTTQIDAQTLRSEIGDLNNENQGLKLKLKGLSSRVSILENAELKNRVNANLAKSDQNDIIIQRLTPKQKRVVNKKKFRGHIGQQSRLSVVILGLYKELKGREFDINHNKVESTEVGLTKEIERLQKRLHLLESSLSCFI